jgi:3-phosphoshikimate 1-carboxyvinyltransferase
VDARGDEKAPLRFEPGALTGRAHVLPVASAQVKSALLLAGLWADGVTSVREPHPSRDHTERMFLAMGAPLERLADGTLCIRRPERPLRMPERLEVPGDPSSAAFLVGAAVLAAQGELDVEGVNTNPTRLGFLRVLERMGADVALVQPGEQAGEPVATVRARGGRALRATDITPDEVPSLLDEVPLLAVVATQAHGTTTIRGAGELRVKESDRLAQVAQHLLRMGARVQELPDGLIIEGPTKLHGVRVDAARDHRIAMAFAVAGRVAEGPTTIDGAEWADISFPGFYGLLAGLR